MSTDYSSGKPIRFYKVTYAAGDGAGLGANNSYVFGQYDFLALCLVARVQVQSSAAASIELQASDETGVAGWTTLGALVVPIGALAVAGAVIHARIPESKAFVSVSSVLSPGVTGPRRCLRLFGTGAGTGLIYDLDVYTTSRHE